MGGDISFSGFEMIGVGEPLRPAARSIEALADDEALIEVAGCGVCHTDVGFLYEGVRTRRPPPLILGHEISGVVRRVGSACPDLVDQAVVVPAVIPCGQCADCQVGRGMICKHQIMPGNDRDGGFASHVVVPARGLCPVPGYSGDPDAPLGGPGGPSLRHLAVVADAVSTPWQAIRRAGLSAGDLAVVIGLGGVGGYAAQIARARGAHVVGLDVDPAKIADPERYRLSAALDPRGVDPRDLRRQIRGIARELGAPANRWTILECSGSAAGQQTAWGLLVHGATLVVVGYTREAIPIRLSNLMAFDARALGTWGCAPAHYPEIVRQALSGAIDLVSHTELRPLDGASAHLEDVRAHRAERRLVLVPGGAP